MYTHTSLLWLKALMLRTSGACHFLSCVGSLALSEMGCVLLRYTEPKPHSLAVKSPPISTLRAPTLPWIHSWLCKYSLKRLTDLIKMHNPFCQCRFSSIQVKVIQCLISVINWTLLMCLNLLWWVQDSCPHKSVLFPL